MGYNGDDDDDYRHQRQSTNQDFFLVHNRFGLFIFVNF
jgi:hypothetical protein